MGIQVNIDLKFGPGCYVGFWLWLNPDADCLDVWQAPWAVLCNDHSCVTNTASSKLRSQDCVLASSAMESPVGCRRLEQPEC
jgi:hypothetical protein